MKAMSRSLNFGKSVSDNGWGMFTTFLKYKLEEQGKKLVKVDKFFASSQICSACGYKNTKTKNLALRKWDCPQCGIHHDRDVNAAINIRNEGMRLVIAWQKLNRIETVGHTGLARLCLARWYYRTRTKPAEVREAPTSIGGGGCHACAEEHIMYDIHLLAK